MNTAGLVEFVLKKEHTKVHLVLAAVVVLVAALSLSYSQYANSNLFVVVGVVFAAWIGYSAVIAKTMSENFFNSFQRALWFDWMTYVPMVLPLFVKIGIDFIGISLPSEFDHLPVMLAFGLGIAANVSGKILLFPKNVEEILDNELFRKKAKLAMIVLAVMIAIYFLFFSTASVMRHESFNSTAFDLGIFDQTIWGYSNGDMLFNTVRGLNLLGDHMHPILFGLAPLYKVLPMPASLLILQTLVLALGAIPVYLIAKRKLGKTTGLLLSASYLLYPSLQYINMFDFHPAAFAVPLLLFAFYFVDVKEYWYAAAMLVLLGLSKEHFPLALTTIGSYVFFVQKNRKVGAIMAIAGLAWFGINFKVLLPYFFGDSTYSHLRGYEYLGSSVTEVAKNTVLNPQLVIGQLLSFDNLSYTLLLLIPVGVVVALIGAPYLLLGLPFFAINMLRTNDLTTAIAYQHNAELIPFLFIATIFGARNFTKVFRLLKLNNVKISVGVFVLLTTVTATVAYGPFTMVYDLDDFSQSEHVMKGKNIISEIPEDSSVSADPLLLPHLTHRKEAYMFPNPFTTFMYGREFWVLEEGTEEGQTKVDYVVMDLSRVSPSYSLERYTVFVSDFVDNDNYGLIKLDDSYALFMKGADYGKGLCELDEYFSTSTDSIIKLELNDILGFNKIYLNDC
jgi:uncharacterized membrane protein